MAKVDPRDFILNTDYELDKIILAKSGNFVGSVQLSHSLSFTPLVFGVWSTSADFSTSHPLGNAETASEPGYTPALGVDCIAQSDKITLTASGDGSGSTRIYYRLIALQPPANNDNAPGTADVAQTFILNTDYNYRKLKATGEFTQTNQTYTHNLGYIPQVMAWTVYENMPSLPAYSNGITPMASGSFFTDYMLEVTSTTLRVKTIPSGLVAKVIWRIYYDEA